MQNDTRITIEISGDCFSGWFTQELYAVDRWVYVTAAYLAAAGISEGAPSLRSLRRLIGERAGVTEIQAAGALDRLIATGCICRDDLMPLRPPPGIVAHIGPAPVDALRCARG